MPGLLPRDMREWMKVTERNIREGQRGTSQTVAAVQKQILDVAEEANKDRGRIPAPPIELTAQTYIMIDPADKRFRAGVIVDFPDVTISTAAEEMTISQYELWGKLAADPDTAYALMDHSEVSALAAFGMDVGSLWMFKVRAIGLFSLAPGEFSAPITVQMLSDTTAPDQPTPPTAANNRGAMTIKWDGKAVTGSMPLDLDYVILAGGTASSPTTEVYRFPPSPNGTLAVLPGVPYNTPMFYRLQAVDTSGNKSPWSAQATATVTPLVDVDIILSNIDAAKTIITNIGSAAIKDGAILDTKLADNAVTQQKIKDGAIVLGKLDQAANDKITKGITDAAAAQSTAATANTTAGTAQATADAAKAAASAAIAQAVNVLADPGFENAVTGWQVLNNCAVVASPTAHGGANVLRATAPASATLIQPEPIAFASVREGQTWRIGFWFRVVGALPTAGDLRVALRAVNDAGTASFPGLTTILPAAMSNNWQWVEGFYKVPAGMVQIKPRLRVDAATTGGTVIEFDDVEMRDTSIAKDALDAAAAAQAKADTAFTNAQTALTNAGLAQTSADGKGRILYTSTTPAGTGYASGDVWFKKLTGGQTQVNIWDTTLTPPQWVPEVDKATADAKAAADAAQAAGTAADGKAVAAQAAATDAATQAALAKVATLPSDRDPNGAGKWLFMRIDLPSAPTTAPPTLDYFAAVTPSTQAQVPDGTDLVKNVGTNYRGLLRTSINVATAGTLTFTASHDDGASIYLDGVQVYTRASFGTAISISIPVTAGWHLLDLVWTEVGGNDGWWGFTPTIGSQVASLVAPGLASVAAAAAATAQAKADQATIDAANAKTAGDNAAVLANAVVKTSTAAATGVPPSVGALWNQTNAAGDLIIGTWTANAAGTAWVQRKLDDAVIGNLNAATINAGIINAARLNASDIRTLFLTAGKITAGDIVTGTLTSASGVFGTVDASVINAGFLNAARLQATDIRALFLTAGKITAGDIVTGTLTSASGVFGTLDASIINAGTINAARYNATDIRTKFLAAGKITAADMVTNTITATSGVIASLDGGVITANSISGISIKAKTISADSLLVGASDNLITDWDFTGQTWGGSLTTNYDAATTFGTSAFSYIVNPSGFSAATMYGPMSNKVPCLAGEIIVPTMYVNPDGPPPVGAESAMVHVRVYFYDSTGTLQENISGGSVAASTLVQNSWNSIGGTQVTVPANRAYFRLRYTYYIPTTGVTTNATRHRLGAMVAYRVVGGNLVALGGITGDHVDAQTVAAKVGSFLTINVSQLNSTSASMGSAVIDRLWTDVVTSRRITAEQLTLSNFSNMLDDGDFKEITNTPWTLYSDATIAPDSGRGNTTALRCLKVPARSGNIVAQQFNKQLVDGDKFMMAAEIYISVATTSATQVYFTGIYKKLDGTAVGSPVTLLAVPSGTGTGWKHWESAELLVPAGAQKMDFQINVASTYTGNVVMDDVRLVRKVDANLIVDGAIVARHLTVTEDMWTNILHYKKLTGAEIDANSLTADSAWIGVLRGGILINDSVDTSDLKADAITSKHTITGALIQTSATALRGVKINTSSGIKAYNSAGVNTFSLDPTTGNMIATGLMQTSPSAQRVVVWDRADGTAAVDMYADTSGQHGSLYTQPTTGGANGGYVTNVMHYTASPITATNWTSRMTLFADESWALGQRTKGATISGDLNGAIRFQGRMVRAANSPDDTFLCGATGTTQAQTGTITVTYGSPSATATRIVVASCNAAGVSQGSTQNETASGFTYVFSTSSNNNNLSLRWWTIWTT